MCYLEAVTGKEPKSANYFKQPSLFLAHFGSEVNFTTYKNALLLERDEYQNTHWADFAIANNVTHLIINTGAWFSPSIIDSFNGQRVIDNEDLLISVYKSHFAPNGELMRTLKALAATHNISVIWRDTTPGGMCGLHTK